MPRARTSQMISRRRDVWAQSRINPRSACKHPSRRLGCRPLDSDGVSRSTRKKADARTITGEFRGRPTPAPTEVGEVRSIRLVSPANAVSITAGSEGPLLATLSFSGITLELAVRKNLYASTSLGTRYPYCKPRDTAEREAVPSQARVSKLLAVR